MELNELKQLLQGQANPEQPDDVNVLSSAQSNPRWSTPQKCFSCGSTAHFQRDCSRTPPVRGRGRNKSRFYCGNPRSSGRARGCFRVYMTWTFFSAYLKGLLKYRRMAFFFLKRLFSFQIYWHFSIMQISSVMTSFGLQLKTGKILNRIIYTCAN